MTLLAALARRGIKNVDDRRTRSRNSPNAPPTRSRVKAASPNSSRSILPICSQGNMALNLQLLDGDTINIPKAQSAFVSGQVKMPGAFAVDTGMTSCSSSRSPEG